MAVRNTVALRGPQRKKARRKKARKKKKRRSYLIAILGFLLLAASVIALIIRLSGNIYTDEQEFQKYASDYFAKVQQEEKSDTDKEVGTKEQALKYNTPISTAIEYPTIPNKKVQKHIKTSIRNLKREFKARNSNAKEEETIAILIHSRVYDSPKAGMGVVLEVTEQKAEDKWMKTNTSRQEVYNFSTKTGLPMTSYQVFKTNYRELCSQYFLDYFEKEYSRDLIQKKYKKALADKESNFNEFILMDQGVRFFFKEGSVVKKGRGQIYVDVDYKQLEDVIYKKALVRYIDPKKPMVALTYDDGPDGKYTDRILNCLEKYGGVATFFEVGKNIKAHRKVVRREAKLGMEIGNHSWSHPDLRGATKKKIKKQIDKTNRALYKACGQKASVFRPPYGSYDPKMKKYAKAPIVLWSVDTLDWKSRNSKKVFKSVKKVKKLDGRVVLMHSIHKPTAKATEKLVPWLIKNDYQLVTVSELLEYRYHERPKKGKLYGYGYFYLD